MYFSKYHAKKVYEYADGTHSTVKDESKKIVATFDSQGEFNRWLELRLMEKAGEIAALQRQVTFELVPNQKTKNGETLSAIKYKADFTYYENGTFIVEDYKGMKTDTYILKKKLMLYIKGIDIKETR